MFRPRADRRDILRGEFTPPGEDRRQGGSRLVESQREKAVAGAARERLLEPVRQSGVERPCSVIGGKQETAVWGETEIEAGHFAPSG